MGDRFTFDQTLGEGAFGKVFKVTDTTDGAQYAMKVIDLSKSPEDEKKMALDEADLLKKLKHENVLSYTDSFQHGGDLCIVTEFCCNGDLSQFLERRNKVPLEEDRLLYWFQQIVKAVQYLHGQKIIHRDLKTPNVFLTEQWDAKLGDFGLAKVLERPNAKAVTFCGSPYYMSPEIFSCKPYDSKSDIWAVGVIVYEMATLERPFDAMLMHQLVFKIVHGGLPPMPDKYSPDLPDVLSQMMQKDSEKRPTADQVLQHQLFRNVKTPKPFSTPKSNALPPVCGRWEKFLVGGKAGDRKEARAVGGRSPGAMKGYLESLSVARARKEQLETRQAQKEALVPGLASIMANTYIDKGQDLDKTVKEIPSITLKSSAVSASGVELTVGDELSATLRASGVKTELEAFSVLQNVVRTLTGVFHGNDFQVPGAVGGADDPQVMLLRQIEQLQFYCIKVMDKDMNMFQKAYDLLSSEKDERILEERLIQILGRQRFAICGVQLLYCKNFEYNLNKLSPVKPAKRPSSGPSRGES